MKRTDHTDREFRVVAAGLFKATCLQLLDEVHKNGNLSIIVTKRGKPVSQLMTSPDGLKLIGPTVQVGAQTVHDVPTLHAEASPAVEEHRKKKKDKKKKHK